MNVIMKPESVYDKCVDYYDVNDNFENENDVHLM